MNKKVERLVLTAVAIPKSGVASSSDSSSLPVYFLSLTINNFRCFGEKQTLDLYSKRHTPARWTIILGDNGVGKTTLLQTLAALRPSLDALDNEKDLDGSYPCIRYYKNNNNYYNNMFINSRQQPSHVALSVSAGTDINKEYTGQPINMMADTGYARLESKKISVGSDSTQVPTLIIHGDQKNLSASVVFGYGASRRPSRSALIEDDKEDACASLFDDNAELINAEEWLLQADYAASKATTNSARAEKRLSTIKRILINLLPDVYDFKFEPLNDRTDLPTVQAKTAYGWVPVRGLSLGYQSLITWMVDLASRLFDRYPESDNPLAEPAVVLVDEIDLHLHPKWQRTLIQFLTDTFPKTQFIVTAHSPLVVQAAPDANIVVLRREGDHVVIDNDVKVVEGWRADQILTSDLFGLSSARPPHMDAALNERDQILSKSKLTNMDEERLRALESQIGDLPTGETPADMEAMDIIRRAAANMKARAGNSK